MGLGGAFTYQGYFMWFCHNFITHRGMIQIMEIWGECQDWGRGRDLSVSKHGEEVRIYHLRLFNINFTKWSIIIRLNANKYFISELVIEQRNKDKEIQYLCEHKSFTWLDSPNLLSSFDSFCQALSSQDRLLEMVETRAGFSGPLAHET